jgi:hypothetical protein
MLNAIDEELSIIEQNIYAVSIINDITYEEASKIKLKKFSLMVDDLSKLNIRMLERLKIDNTILLNGSKYHLEHKPEKLTSGQLLDVINIRSKHQGEGVQVMDLLLAAMAIPKGKMYGDDGLSLNERAALIRGAKLSEVWNIFVFFWNLWNGYLDDTEDSLTKWMEKSTKMVQEILDEDGGYSA